MSVNSTVFVFRGGLSFDLPSILFDYQTFHKFHVDSMEILIIRLILFFYKAFWQNFKSPFIYKKNQKIGQDIRENIVMIFWNFLFRFQSWNELALILWGPFYFISTNLLKNRRFRKKAAGKVQVFRKGHKNLKKSPTCFDITE